MEKIAHHNILQKWVFRRKNTYLDNFNNDICDRKKSFFDKSSQESDTGSNSTDSSESDDTGNEDDTEISANQEWKKTNERHDSKNYIYTVKVGFQFDDDDNKEEINMFSPPEEKMYQVKENMITRMNKDEHHIGKKNSLDDLYFKINDLKLELRDMAVW